MIKKVSRYLKKLFHKECKSGVWVYHTDELNMPEIPTIPGIRGDMTAYKLERYGGKLTVYYKECTKCGRKVHVTKEEYESVGQDII